MRYRRPYWASESQMAVAVAEVYRQRGWTIYPEVMGVDLIGVKPDEQGLIQVMAVECKLQWNAKVLEQGWHNHQQGYVDISICIAGEARAPRPFFRAAAQAFGLGLAFFTGGALREVQPPLLKPRTDDTLLNCLHAQALAHTVPGLPSCKRWGPWDALEQKWVAYIQEQKARAPRGLWDGRVAIGAIITAVEPQTLGKRGQPLQKVIDTRTALILSGRWKHLRLDGQMVSIRGSD